MSALLLAMVLAADAPDSWLRFSHPARCELNEESRAALDERVLAVRRSKPVTLDARRKLYTERLAVGASWQGLPLREIVRKYGDESGPFNTYYVFDVAPDALRERLNRLGFNTPPVGQSREIDQLAIQSWIAVEPRPGGAALACLVD